MSRPLILGQINEKKGNLYTHTQHTQQTQHTGCVKHFYSPQNFRFILLSPFIYLLQTPKFSIYFAAINPIIQSVYKNQ